MRQITILWLLVALLAVVSVGLFVKLESVQTHQNDALHAVICYADHAVRIRPDIPPQQRHEALAFYHHALDLAQLKPCP